MESYPQLILPDKIKEILKRNEFITVHEPQKPNEPENPNAHIFKIGMLIFGVLFLMLNQILLGAILVVISVAWLIMNPEGKAFENYKKLYEVKMLEYEKETLIFKSNPANYISDLKNRERKKMLLTELKQTVMPTKEADYKKGVTHDFFKKHLLKNIGDKIIENAALRISNNYRNNLVEYKRPYITDFAYVDEQNGICLAIEIDEPYTLKDKKPIHTSEWIRNDFFLNYNWIILRFAEEQIVLYPELCCKLIKEIIRLIVEDLSFSYPFTIKCSIPNIPLWTDETIKNLILQDYRNKYLNKLTNLN